MWLVLLRYRSTVHVSHQIYQFWGRLTAQSSTSQTQHHKSHPSSECAMLSCLAGLATQHQGQAQLILSLLTYKESCSRRFSFLACSNHRLPTAQILGKRSYSGEQHQAHLNTPWQISSSFLQAQKAEDVQGNSNRFCYVDKKQGIFFRKKRAKSFRMTYSEGY